MILSDLRKHMRVYVPTIFTANKDEWAECIVEGWTATHANLRCGDDIRIFRTISSLQLELPKGATLYEP